MASEADAATAVAIPAASDDDDGLYAHAHPDVDMAESGPSPDRAADNADNGDEYESSLSSPTSSLSSANEALLESTPFALDGAQDLPDSPLASASVHDDILADADADADVAADTAGAAAIPDVPPATAEDGAETETRLSLPAATSSIAVATTQPEIETPSFANAIAAISAVAVPLASTTQPARDPSESRAQEDSQLGATAGAEVESNEPGIDIDKMLDAISADAPPPAPGQPAATGIDKAQTFPYAAAGAPGTVGGMAVLGAPPSSVADHSNEAAPSNYPAPSRRGNNAKGANKSPVDKAYEEFLLEERRYMADPDWEKFPDGSRMFIGNLSQERVSKRDVFEAFHRFGRLAQISIKSAYGFVQYHKASEASDAMKNLQGFEIRGRKINLELSRPQKKEKERERERSPERKTRGGRGGDRGGDRYDGREHGREHGRRRGRDDYRPDAKEGRDSSPRRDRGGDRERDRERGGRGRERSRSPNRAGAGGNGRSYRSRRSASPHGRNRGDHGGSSADGLKSRHGSDVPDVQFLVTQGLERDFIKWVQGAFAERGLKTDIMLMTPHSPSRDAVIQTHVLEGVIAVVDLNIGAQSTFRIPLQVFDRSAGSRNVRFDGYQDLTPQIAADVVARAKAATVAANQRPLPYQAPSGYGQQPAYGGAAPPAQVAPGPQGYGGGFPAAQAPAAAQPQAGAYDLAALMSQLDGSALSQLLATLQPAQAAAVPATTMAASAYGQSGQYGQGGAPPMNLGALLSTLGAQTAAPVQNVTAGPYGGAAGYAGGLPGGAPGQYMAAPQNANDQNIQAIMAQLAQYKK